ncbi:hypothetical protein [Methanimicrococcus stummii]|uniref:hypothetical protein n=1 Tax=Methanimicrococcus stummii TaxID=3028294 RepID=UPI002931E5C7|nr:hypothetical protein [Methanimicrococcus sp. Es2]
MKGGVGDSPQAFGETKKPLFRNKNFYLPIGFVIPCANQVCVSACRSGLRSACIFFLEHPFASRTWGHYLPRHCHCHHCRIAIAAAREPHRFLKNIKTEI